VCILLAHAQFRTRFVVGYQRALFTRVILLIGYFPGPRGTDPDTPMKACQARIIHDVKSALRKESFPSRPTYEITTTYITNGRFPAIGISLTFRPMDYKLIRTSKYHVRLKATVPGLFGRKLSKS
jgi:hypothetical protein